MTIDNALLQEQRPASEMTTKLDNLITAFDKIKNLYAIEDSLEVFQMMLEQEAIVLLVLEAYDRIRALFPVERLELKVIPDAEIPSWRSMWISIFTKLEVEEAFLKLKSLDHTWWIDAKMNAPKNDLHIDLGWE